MPVQQKKKIVKVCSRNRWTLGEDETAKRGSSVTDRMNGVKAQLMHLL